jgi:hypothetical protein
MPNVLGAPITKSQFKLGLNCLHKLRHARDKLPQVSQENETLRLLTEGSATVEALVRATEPGRLIGGSKETALTDSNEALTAALAAAAIGTTTLLYKVTIADGGFIACFDLLRIRPDAIELVEIKSKSVEGTDNRVDTGEFLTNQGTVRSEWLANIQDLAFQRELLQRALNTMGQRSGTPIHQPVQNLNLIPNHKHSQLES